MISQETWPNLTRSHPCTSLPYTPWRVARRSNGAKLVTLDSQRMSTGSLGSPNGFTDLDLDLLQQILYLLPWQIWQQSQRSHPCKRVGGLRDLVPQIGVGAGLIPICMRFDDLRGQLQVGLLRVVLFAGISHVIHKPEGARKDSPRKNRDE